MEDLKLLKGWWNNVEKDHLWRRGVLVEGGATPGRGEGAHSCTGAREGLRH